MKSSEFVIVVFAAMFAGLSLFVSFKNTELKSQLQESNTVLERVESEIDQAVWQLQPEINAIQAKDVRFFGDNMPPCAAPMPYYGMNWQVDLKVKLQYYRWQVEFLIRYANRQKPDRGKPIGTAVGAVGTTESED